LMAEMLPLVRRVAVLVDLSQPKSQRDRYEQIAKAAATARGLALEAHRVKSREEVRQVFRNPETRQADALVIGPAPLFNVLRPEICQSAARIRLPVVGFSEEWPQDGALMSFSPSWPEAYRRAAYFVDRIIKGTKPADLPIEQPTKFSLVINLKTAKALDIKIPQSILLRADRVIE